MPRQELDTISIDASLSETGISLSTKSRFASALDRMFGGLLDIPAAFFEGRAANIELRDRLAQESLEARARASLDGEIKLEELRIASDYLRRQVDAKKLINLGNVSQLALEDLRDSAKGTNGPHDDVESSEQISDDWLNWFQSFAEKASSADIRGLWGRVLSGESQRPGQFSIGTLRTLAELDRRTAMLFQKHVDHVVGDRYIIKKPELAGELLVELTSLEDAGLLREVNGMITLTYKFNAEGKHHFSENGLILELEGSPETEIRLAVLLLSRAGQELLTVLPHLTLDTAYRKIGEFAPANVIKIKLGVVVADHGDGQVSWTTTEFLRGNEAEAP